MKRDPITRLRLVAGFALVVRIALGCMFLYSSLPKIQQPYDFLSSVCNRLGHVPRSGDKLRLL